MVTNLLFFFLYFHYHQIWDECYFCKTQHKKIHNDETAESEALHPSIYASRRLSQPWGCSEQQSCQKETLRDKLGDICSAEPQQEPNHRYHHSSVLPETHWPRPIWQPQSQQEVACLGLAQNTLQLLRAPGIAQALLRDLSDTARPAAAEGSKQTSLCKAAMTAEINCTGWRNLTWAASPMTMEELLWGKQGEEEQYLPTSSPRHSAGARLAVSPGLSPCSTEDSVGEAPTLQPMGRMG